MNRDTNSTKYPDLRPITNPPPPSGFRSATPTEIIQGPRRSDHARPPPETNSRCYYF
ncbi:hypothetical protein BDW59DRAFT_148472 [Aspergillus cavernicola]|uniref:Uncharacterized protein n=1 Tax=Aspergillus cavernicola TaxID=176166 RepID=A0ABR4I7R0_9EURO